jgi:hypothetical protein
MRARSVVLLGPLVNGAGACARLLSAFAACALCLLVAGVARADDERLVLMREPTPYTDVIDAAEVHDKFDLNVRVGYTRTLDKGTIAREHTTASGERRRTPLADSDHVSSQLMLGLDVGLYRDLMAFVRVPLILSETRKLKRTSGLSQDQAQRLLTDPGDFPDGDGTLFDLPVASPTRAGFDYLAFGGAVAITSQERKEWLPTWVVLVEGRRAIGGVMKPCHQDDEGKTLCNAGSQDDGVNLLSTGSSGASRGVSALSLETRVSKRVRYAEPYAGLGMLLEWASSGRKNFKPAGDLPGVTQSGPPKQFFATLGSEIIPWEHRGRYQRVALDMRLQGTYFTRGLDYSALYDALGSSDHGALAQANYEGVRGAPSASSGQCSDSADSDCYVGKRVPFNGLTELSSHLRYGARLGVDLRAARYVRFALGAGVAWVSAFALTSSPACNDSASANGRATGSSGQECGSHASNPQYRGTIDAPGRRFWLTSQVLLDLYASATAQF